MVAYGSKVLMHVWLEDGLNREEKENLRQRLIEEFGFIVREFAEDIEAFDMGIMLTGVVDAARIYDIKALAGVSFVSIEIE